MSKFLTKLPVVSNIIDNLAEEDESERVIDFTDTTGLGDDQENYYSDSADDEPAPVNVKAIAGTLFHGASAPTSNGIGSIVVGFLKRVDPNSFIGILKVQKRPI